MLSFFLCKQKTAYEMLRSFVGKQKTAYEMLRSLVGSEMCIRDSVDPTQQGDVSGHARILPAQAALRCPTRSIRTASRKARLSCERHQAPRTIRGPHGE